MDFCLTNNSFIIFNSYPCILTARDAGYANLYIFNYIAIGHTSFVVAFIVLLFWILMISATLLVWLHLLWREADEDLSLFVYLTSMHNQSNLHD